MELILLNKQMQTRVITLSFLCPCLTRASYLTLPWASSCTGNTFELEAGYEETKQRNP